MSWKCEYIRTLSGNCEQPKAPGRKECYFHSKVVDDLLESDPQSEIKRAQTMRGTSDK